MKTRGLQMCEHSRTCSDFTNQSVRCVNGPYATCKEAQLQGAPKTLDLQVFICPTMGAVSPKICTSGSCRTQQEGHCPQGKKEASEAGW